MRLDPIAYDPTVEVLEEGEAETIQGLVESLHSIASTTFRDSGHALRSVHAKSHGILVGELHIPADLPPILAQGLFAFPGTLPVVVRFSTTPGDLLDDTVSTPRGMAIKVLGAGRLHSPPRASDSQDFVLVNGPAFAAPNLKGFLKNLKLLAKTTDRSPGLKKALSALLRGAETIVEKVGGESSTLKSLGGHPLTNLLGETYYSQVPILFGPYMAKIAVAPVSSELKDLTNSTVDLRDDPNGLRHAVVEYFNSRGGEWELQVQLCSDLKAMPIEDASVEWPQSKSPYLTVARLSLPAQNAWSARRVEYVESQLSFDPWHCLPEHRPLGSIMRGRKVIYEQASKFRFEQARARPVEPADISSIPE